MEWTFLALMVVIAAALGLGVVQVRKRRARAPAEALSSSEPTRGPVGSLPRDIEHTLEVTRSALSTKLSKFFQLKRELDNQEWNRLEEGLLTSDVGVSTSHNLIGAVKERLKSESQKGGVSLRQILIEEAIKLFPAQNAQIDGARETTKPLVISVVGVNGAGKTTTIGKLCAHFAKEGKSVLVGAGDTFRAAAVSQLKVWVERAQSDFVCGREGADPASVAFDSVTAGKARNKDVVIIDTAGRLHTKENLMEELKKVHRVMKKVIPDAPHEVFLVLDGTTGQNSLAQARQFHSDLGITGLIVTKLDGTAKGGAVLGICRELSVPVRFIGVGESADDLIVFNGRRYVEALLGLVNV